MTKDEYMLVKNLELMTCARLLLEQCAPTPANAINKLDEVIIELQKTCPAPENLPNASLADDPLGSKPWTPKALAKLWGCSDKHIRDMIHSGELGHFRIGTLIRIPDSEVERVTRAGSG